MWLLLYLFATYVNIILRVWYFLPSEKNVVKLHLKQVTSDLLAQVTKGLPWNGDQSSVDTINAVEWSVVWSTEYNN